MPENIKKILMQKVVSGTLYSIYPKTQADIVVYNKTVDNNGTPEVQSTTVAAELLALASQGTADLAEAKTYTDNKVKDLQDAIEGLSDNESLVAAFDTLKEIGDWLEGTDNTSAATIVSDIATLKTKVGSAAVAESGTPGQDGYVAPVASTGLFALVDAVSARVKVLEDNGGNHVEASLNNGYIQVGTVGNMSDVLVYDDTELQTKVGHAATTAGVGGATETAASTGLFAADDAIWAEIGGVSDAGTTLRGRLNALETALGDKANDTALSDTVYGKLAGLREDLGTSADASNATGTAFARISALVDAIGADATANTVKGRIKVLEDLVGTAGDPNASPAVAATGLHLAIDNLEAKVDALHTVSYVTSSPSTPNANLLYLVEIA